MDEELFELCREVYKRTKWGQYGYEGLDYYDVKPAVPLYTSDYLLEKLPADTQVSRHKYASRAEAQPGGYGTKRKYVTASTPRKALLKLVIALDDSGVKLNA